MRKINVLTMVTLDGVMQAPGGPDEDTASGFKYGGWEWAYADEFSGNMINEQISRPADLLLGRKTYDIFAAYWPNQDKSDVIAGAFDRATKYVVSHRNPDLAWEKSELITGDVVKRIKELKQQDGPDLQVHGSGNLIQTLLKNDLVDEFWLKIFPITLGTGNRLFGNGTIPAAYSVKESKTSPRGVIFVTLVRSGDVRTGSFADQNPSQEELARREKMKIEG